MLTIFRASSRSDAGSDSTEEIVRDGYPYYFKKNNGRMVMARNISRSRGNKNFSLLGQAFGIDEPKRISDVNALKRGGKKKKKKKPAQLQYPPQPQPPFSAPLPQQPFPNFPPLHTSFAAVNPQQPFPSPNFFAPTNSLFPSFYPFPGFTAAPAPAPAPAWTPAQQPMRWAVQSKSSKPPNFEELQKVESDFLKREKSKSRTRDGDHDDHTETKTTITTTTITKHICVRCRRDRSAKYHLEHPIKSGETPTPGFCRKCRRNATSTSGSSSDDSDDGDSRRHGNGGKGSERKKASKKKYKRKTTSRPNSVEFLSQDEKRDNGRSNDYGDEIILEEEAVHKRETVPKSQARRTDNNSRVSLSRSYTRSHERNLDDDDLTPRGEPKVRISITNRSLSASPPSSVYEAREKSVHFDQPAGGSNAAPQATSQQDLRESYRYVEPLRSATSYASMPRSVRFSRESLPGLHTGDHVQRRRSERAYTERTYDHDACEQEYEHIPRRRSDENVIVAETEHEHPRSRTESRYQPRPRPRSSYNDFIDVEAEDEYPRFQTERPRHEPRGPQERRRNPARSPVRTRETYITSEVDQYGNETQYRWTTRRASSSSSSAISFIPSSHRTPTDVHRRSIVRHSSESSEEYNRAYEMAHQNLPNPGPRRRQRSSFRSSEGFMDGTNTPPRVPDPPTSGGVWEPRNTRSARRRGRSSSQSNVSQVPQHQSTPRNNQAWMNASIIDQLGQRLEHNRPSLVRSQSSDSRSSGLMVTQSDSFITPPPSDSPYELDSSDSTPLSLAPFPVSIHETTESDNEVESIIATPSPKATITKKSVETSSRRRNGRAEITNSQAKDNGHAIGSTFQKYNGQLGSHSSYVEYGVAAIISRGTNRANANKRTQVIVDDDDNATILDDATDLTLRTARSKTAMLDRRAARRRVSFANSPQFATTPEQSRENSWAANPNSNGEESWGANKNTDESQSWGPTANTDADDPWEANTTGDNSWGANTNTTGNDLWSSNTETGSILPEVGGYSGLQRGNDSNSDFSGYGSACPPTRKTKYENSPGIGGDDYNSKKVKEDDDWGPMPTFSSLNI
ncbi:4729943b-e046-4fb5-aae0-7e7257752086 [Sclerotinia trifoliorum]|uniref:4729943b-e046-4fb5-aae0-7e7257752086 n=1 Tax=Sclerotinia trifoliorum TaxID=28548 RepID=A0A8H2ZLQ4_9HELO|nr:4729943b-e046-4fb5-aae0-7e7257752086 [Sclerotinia trifoliorum]